MTLPVEHPKPTSEPAPSRRIPRVKCERPTCTFPAVATLLAYPSKRKADVRGPFPLRQRLCAGCIVTEARVADGMGYVPDGEELA